MAERRKKRRNGKYLGRGSHGCGNVKNRRGSGNRGGRGNAGRCKHKASWVATYQKDYFGKHGFFNQSAPARLQSIQLFEINRKAVLGKLDKTSGKFVFEFNGKILATGEVSVPLFVKAKSWTKRVEQKIKEAGGEIVTLG